jgi:hypothetical protein
MGVALLALTHVMLLIHSFIGFYNFKFKLASCMKQHTVMDQYGAALSAAAAFFLFLQESSFNPSLSGFNGCNLGATQII